MYKHKKFFFTKYIGMPMKRTPSHNYTMKNHIEDCTSISI